MKKFNYIKSFTVLGAMFMISSCTPESPIIIEEPVVLSALSINMDKTNYELNEKLSDYLDEVLHVTLTYSNNESVTASYSDLSVLDLKATLRNPENQIYSRTASFNVVGNWDFEVSYIRNTSISDHLSLTVEDTSGLKVESVTLSQTETRIEEEKSTQLTAEVKPATAINKKVTWTSSDETVATVYNNGVVTALKAGQTTITATTEDGGKTATCVVTVFEKIINSESIELNSYSQILTIGEGFQLTAKVLPEETTDKTVIWTSSDNKVVSVNEEGLISTNSIGEAVITAKNGSTTAACNIKVTSKEEKGDWKIVTSIDEINAGDMIVFASNAHGVVSGAFTSGHFNYVNATFSSEKNYILSLPSSAEVLTVGGSSGKWTFANSGNNLLGASSNGNSLKWAEGTTTWNMSTMSNGISIRNTTTTYGKIVYNQSSKFFSNYSSASSYTTPQIYKFSPSEPVAPTSISLTSISGEVRQGKTLQLSVLYYPSYATIDKEVEWKSSNTSIATVSNTGLVTVKATAAIGASCYITAKLTNIPSADEATYRLVVGDSSNDYATVLIYLCGNDLESQSGLATKDINEILKVSGQPDDINIVIQTGGANRWSTSSITASKNCRFHVENKKLVKDEEISYQNMGAASTLQNFLEYGLENYPADKVGLILWNHGGAMEGVCYDERQGNDSLTNDECRSAFRSVFANRHLTSKLEWIGYDACLMCVQDVADFNSEFFNYMVAAQESESGYGWDYDNWVDDLYAYKDTKTVLKAICDTFVTDNYSISSPYNDATLSVLDLSKAAQYREAWENMAVALNDLIGTNSSKWSSFKSTVNSCDKYGGSYGSYPYNVFDAGNLISKLLSSSTYSSISSYVRALQDAHKNFIYYETHGAAHANSTGLSFYFPYYGYYNQSVYSSNRTDYTNWRTFVFSH